MPIDHDVRLRKLFENHYHEVLAYCVRRSGHSDADDAASEVFATAWRRIDEMRPETARPWLFGIARRVLANRWRSTQRRMRLTEKVAGLAPVPPETPEVYMVRLERDEEVIRTLRQLRPTDREVLMLAAWEQLTAPEIAIALRVSVAAAEQRLHRAKKRLAIALGSQPKNSTFSPRAAREEGKR